jgi:two-component system, NtrC family, response regulator AtoC
MDSSNFKPRPSSTLTEVTHTGGQPRSPRSILVVDDEENFLILLEWFLSQRGYEVVTASSAEAALKLLSGRKFDIALVDVRLGTSDGLALLEEITKCLPRPNVFMMTAYPTVSSIKQAFDKGASRYLTKPVDLQELAKAVGSMF